MRKKKDETKLSNQISIRITDADKWEALNRLKEEGKYKSFNTLINEFIDDGIDRRLNPDKTKTEEDFDAEKQERAIDKDSAEFYEVLTNLMQEVVLNAVICKSILCSLYEDKILEREGIRSSSEALKKGNYAETPLYLKRFEKMMTDKINKSNKSVREN